MARTRCQHCFKKASYTCNINSKRKNETGKTTSSIDKEAITVTENQDSTGREIIQRSHIRFFPTSETPNAKTNEVMCSMITNDEKPMVYMDLTGRFTYCSASAHGYLLVTGITIIPMQYWLNH